MSSLDLVNVSIIFGMVIMPLTYYPILHVAADRKIMGTHVNSRFLTTMGVAFLVLITIAAVTAIPLMIVTHSGKP
jgi:Mn2+/Fe2+ NRAMP family transporter